MKGNKRLAMAALVGCFVVCGFAWPAAAQLDDKPSGGEPATDANAKPDDADVQRRTTDVTLAERLSFREEQIKAEMTELEQRMFRLSEALEKLEPDNASRLTIGLRFARQELILYQMKEVQEALASMRLRGAVEEQKQLVAKLERLQQLLLSTDLDFEMRLARLRQIRETLRELDKVIKEESRQQRASREAAETEKRLAKLTERKATLADLIKQQSEHVKRTTPLAKQKQLSDAQRDQVAELATAQQATHNSAQALASELQDGATSKNLAGAVEQMQAAAGALNKTAPGEALPPMEKALELLKQEHADVAAAEVKAKQALAQQKFAAMRKEQEANRGATDEVTAMTRQLGSSGTAALPELLRASGSMAGAEGAFGKGQAGAGNAEQRKALASLNYAKELLAEEAERLARELRAEVKKRVMEGLTLMLEMQVAVRERTEALAPGVKKRSRQALVALASLAKREEKITATADELINIVEETEFGIALPAALAAVADATEGVQISLAEGDASPEVIAAEKRIEADLKEMLEIVSEMSDANSRRGRRGGNNTPQERRKELNRIISELRMLRLLELRVKENTVQVDARRGKQKSLTAELRRRVEQLEGRQSDIQEAAELLAIERADDLPQPQP